MCIVNTTFTYDNVTGGAIAIDIYKGSIPATGSNNSIFKTSLGPYDKMVGLDDYDSIEYGANTEKGTIKEFTNRVEFESSKVITGSSSGQNYGVKITSTEEYNGGDHRPVILDGGDGNLRLYVEYLTFA